MTNALTSDARLVSRILIDRDMDTPLSRGVSARLLQNPSYRDAFAWICDHVSKYDTVPSAVLLRKEFPSIRLTDATDPMDVLIDRVFEDFRKARMIELAETVSVRMDATRWSSDDVLADINRILSEVEQITPDAAGVDLTSDPLSRLDAYRAKKNSSGLLGPSTGFPTIDAATLGLQKQQLVTIVAAPKTGKSQLALKIAKTVHEFGLVPAFVSFEMSNDEQARRFDSMKFNLSHTRLLGGDLTNDEEKAYKRGLKGMRLSHSFHLVDSSTGMTVSAVAAKARELKVDVLFIDGVYLMIDEVTGDSGTPQALTNITRSLKRTAQRLNIPIVISTQTLTWKMNKNKLSPNSIGYSSSFYQDSDVILGLERGDEEQGENYRLLRILASRNTGPAEVDLNWDWNTGTFEELDGDGYTEF